MFVDYEIIILHNNPPQKKDILKHNLKVIILLSILFLSVIQCRTDHVFYMILYTLM